MNYFLITFLILGVVCIYAGIFLYRDPVRFFEFSVTIDAYIAKQSRFIITLTKITGILFILLGIFMLLLFVLLWSI